MFRKMRRAKQELSAERARQILAEGSYGTLALAGDDDYPYAVPLNYVLVGESAYFHCAAKGHKIDAIARNPKASMCVVEADTVVPEEATTYFSSAIAFGRVTVVEDRDERWNALIALMEKYSWEFPEIHESEAASCIDHVCILRLDIEHLSGKEAIELVRQHKDGF